MIEIQNQNNNKTPILSLCKNQRRFLLLRISEKLIINQAKAQAKINAVINRKSKTLFNRTILLVILKSIQVQKVNQVKNNQLLKVFKVVRKI